MNRDTIAEKMNAVSAKLAKAKEDFDAVALAYPQSQDLARLRAAQDQVKSLNLELEALEAAAAGVEEARFRAEQKARESSDANARQVAIQTVKDALEKRDEAAAAIGDAFETIRTSLKVMRETMASARQAVSVFGLEARQRFDNPFGSGAYLTYAISDLMTVAGLYPMTGRVEPTVLASNPYDPANPNHQNFADEIRKIHARARAVIEGIEESETEK